MKQIENQEPTDYLTPVEESDTVKWFWMMNYCNQRGLSPANSHNWNKAEAAWNRRKNIEHQGDSNG